MRSLRHTILVRAMNIIWTGQLADVMAKQGCFLKTNTDCCATVWAELRVCLKKSVLAKGDYCKSTQVHPCSPVSIDLLEPTRKLLTALILFHLIWTNPSLPILSSQLPEWFGQNSTGHLYTHSTGCAEDQSQNHRHCGDALHFQRPAL